MRTRNLGIVMDQGADFSLTIGIFGEAGPIDLTGYAFKSQMRKSSDPAGVAIAEFSFQILDQVASKGLVRWYLAEDAVDAITTSIANPLRDNRLTTPFIFDVKMKDLMGQVTRIVQGIIEVSPEATQEEFS